MPISQELVSLVKRVDGFNVSAIHFITHTLGYGNAQDKGYALQTCGDWRSKQWISLNNLIGWYTTGRSQIWVRGGCPSRTSFQYRRGPSTDPKASSSKFLYQSWLLLDVRSARSWPCKSCIFRQGSSRGSLWHDCIAESKRWIRLHTEREDTFGPHVRACQWCKDPHQASSSFVA